MRQAEQPKGGRVLTVSCQPASCFPAPWLPSWAGRPR